MYIVYTQYIQYIQYIHACERAIDSIKVYRISWMPLSLGKSEFGPLSRRGWKTGGRSILGANVAPLYRNYQLKASML